VSSILRVSKARFFLRTQEALTLFQSSGMWYVRSGERYTPIKNRYKFDIASFSFFEIVLAWEDFIEDAFLTLMVKAKRYTRGCRSMVVVDSKIKAFEMLKGDGKLPYIDWADVESIRKRATNIFKNGRPFEEPLSSGVIHFKRMRTIRNLIAHNSRHAQKKFEDLIRDLYGSAQNFTPGELISQSCPASIGLPPKIEPKGTILETYANILMTIVSHIASV
jgi:hypothetical protein